MNAIRVITAFIIYFIYSFAEWDFNIANWGFFARLTFILLVVISAISWWVLGVFINDMKKEETDKEKQSKFQERVNDLKSKYKQN